MSEIELDKVEDLKALNGFVSKMESIKRKFEKENNIYKNKGVLAFNKSPTDLFLIMEEMQHLYQDFGRDALLSRLSKEKIEEFSKKHEAFQKSVKEYELHVQVSMRIANMVVDATKDSIERETKTDLGYDKEAALMSEKKMLENMPSVSVNNRV